MLLSLLLNLSYKQDLSLLLCLLLYLIRVERIQMRSVVALNLLDQVLYLHLFELILLIEAVLVLLYLLINFFIFLLVFFLLLARLLIFFTGGNWQSLDRDEWLHQLKSALTGQVLVQRVIILQCDLSARCMKLLMHLKPA